MVVSLIEKAHERLVQDALQRLMPERTTLVIAHRLSTIEHADQVLVMDGANESAARRICPESEWHRVQRLTDFCTEHSAREVPDPYYGGDRGFEDVLDLVEVITSWGPCS